MTLSPRRTRAMLIACAALAACDSAAPLTPDANPSDAAAVAALDCRVDLRASATVSCATSHPTGPGSRLIVGNQGTYVFLQAGPVTVDTLDHVVSFETTVQNLLWQPLGTADGTTMDPEGVQVIFHEAPASTGAGAVTLLTEDGTGDFTRAGQSFIRYDQILAPNATSDPRRWEFSVDAETPGFVFKVYVRARVPFPDGGVQVTPPADTLAAGATAQLSATVRTVVGGVVAGQTVTWGTSDAGVLTVNAAGLVTAVAPGTATVTATAGVRTGSATISVCPSLAVGGLYLAPASAGNVCLAGTGAGAEYVAIPVNLDGNPVALGVTGAGIIPVSGAPSPSPALALGGLASAPARGARWEDALRTREHRELSPRMQSARAAGRGISRVITPGTPAVGALMSLNVETDNLCSTNDLRTGRVTAVGDRIIVLADTANPSGGLTAADYQAVADSFDAVVHPVVTANMGTPADLDANGRVVAFFTRAVNELAPPGAAEYTTGFSLRRDLLSTTICPTSNRGELIYLMAGDPSGTVNGNARTSAAVRAVTLSTLAHEYAHLTNASRRLYITGAAEFEEPWLDEGLALAAEELVFYDRAGLAPGANLSAAEVMDGGNHQASFLKYAYPLFAQYRRALLASESTGFFSSAGSAATRGAAWAFLRYAADRRGGSQAAFWSALVDGRVNAGDPPTTGMTNVARAIGADPRGWIPDFAAAVYADDAVAGAGAAFRFASWDFRGLFGVLDFAAAPGCDCAFPLATRNPANGIKDSFTLVGGGAAGYLRLGVAPNGYAGVTVRSGTSAPPSTTRLAILRRR